MLFILFRFLVAALIKISTRFLSIQNLKCSQVATNDMIYGANSVTQNKFAPYKLPFFKKKTKNAFALFSGSRLEASTYVKAYVVLNHELLTKN
jgi:hypothetical protein